MPAESFSTAVAFTGAEAWKPPAPTVSGAVVFVDRFVIGTSRAAASGRANFSGKFVGSSGYLATGLYRK